MENLLHDLVCHGLKGRKIALIENGSWAATSAKGMKEILSGLKDTEFIGEAFSFKSSLHGSGEALGLLADAIIKTM